ncbi:hypothetical protein ILUMI_04323, partial [Ignelater luminosus]
DVKTSVPTDDKKDKGKPKKNAQIESGGGTNRVGDGVAPSGVEDAAFAVMFATPSLQRMEFEFALTGSSDSEGSSDGFQQASRRTSKRRCKAASDDRQSTISTVN